jgi:hypothetical protein
MNDPFSSALASIGSNLAGIGTGENPLFAPSVANIFGFNIQGIPLISARNFFLVQMETWVTSIPLQTQWIVLINNYPKCINTSILQNLERVDGGKKGFDINRAKSILTAFPLQKITGCIFAQGFNIPPDSFAVSYPKIENSRGFLSAPIAEVRTDPGTLTLDFLETNLSFTDFIIRPWVIAGSHFGFVARNPRDSSESIKNVKTTVTVLQYTRTFQNISMIPRKIWHFYNCAPIGIGDRQGTYDPGAESFSPGRAYFSTSWVYSHYTVENNLYLPLTSIINRLANGIVPIISPLQSGGGGFPGGINPAGLF